MYYARVVFEKNASTCERHDDLDAARRWIEQEQQARPDLFRVGEIFVSAPMLAVVESCDADGWRAS